MKLLKYLCIGISALSILSCSDWTSEEREVFENQEGMHRLIPLIEAQTEEDLTPTMREYFAQIREYRKTPHVKGFGWFGNWTGKGNNAQNYLKMLPDSVDFVSLWGTRGYLSDEQKADLKFFQEVKGGKALLCWIIQDLGDQLTPKGLNATQYWVEEKGQGNFIEGVKAYASGNNKMQVFIETLSARLRPAGRMLVMDGQPDLLSTETSKLVDHYIYQAYWESSTSSVIYKINKPNLDDWERKTIITVEFEQGWKTGGITYYTSVRPELNSMEGNQILDYATLDLPSGKRIGGIGTYHMEYDYPNDPPYKWLRKALYFGNQVYPGKFD